MELREQEMYEINGGVLSWKVLAAIGAGLVWIVGVISGYTNPDKCNNR